MNTEYELPQSGKPYFLLSTQEVESFNYYKKNGGPLGIHVSLKTHRTDHYGVQLIVVVKDIRNTISINSDLAIDTMSVYHGDYASDDYKERLKESKAKNLAELFAVPTSLEVPKAPPALPTTPPPLRLKVEDRSKSDDELPPPLSMVSQNYKIDRQPSKAKPQDQMIRAPRTFLERIKILFGIYPS